ncbi:N,N'-diacetylchitobiose transport system substrate-binding protein [Saccharopolyspora lacisalsi]|uniref:N,N'-diacetylchitobiose transport system substrate-binding protein n=1 Tax=Halosaccharopolyspora lacisalsi TaxID=1000566 RepID=A0A839E3T2_9PSEU|nr:extracellular solute-binding protein [Halosaccharopolyspora lacisalsi]MBA8826031.1 N,N'-diacetylchitobiose transport system substrate-binding protein [Halosaccharopolyspora lacisalsi]
MKAWRPLAAATVAVLLTACGPPQVDRTGPQQDKRTGTLRVWLFDEANREPKETVVNKAVRQFEAAHADVTVDVRYIPVDSRSERFTGAFNDPSSAPDVAEFGNTDLASYVAADGFADLTGMLERWPAADDLSPSVLDTAKIDGKVHGVPWFTGIRALYYRTDVFTELGLEPPRTLDELVTTARRIRQARPDLYGISAGGKYHYAMMPFVWAAGGDIATRDNGSWTSALTGEAARRGVNTYASLISPGICPPAQCAGMTGTESVQAFAGGKAAMTIGGDFNRAAVDAGPVGDDYAVVPLPGYEAGSAAPAFAGGNLLGVMDSSDHSTLAREFIKVLAGKERQREMYEAMGNLPTFTDVQRRVAGDDPWIEPFIRSLQSGTRFVPATPAWSEIDAQEILPTMVQRIATGTDPKEATRRASEQLNAAFGD